MNLLRATHKGAATREMIIERAYAIACRHGLEGLSIGELATAAGMSKSGVFAHFGSREDLQLTVLDWTAERFGETVVMPALRQPRGLPRLRAIMFAWFDWVRDNPDGCIMLGAAGEYDGRPGVLRDRVVAWLSEWRMQLAKAIRMCVESGELAADTDPELMSFELFSITEGLHHARLYDPQQAQTLARRSFERVLKAYSPQATSPQQQPH
ncbi:TetR/AcrR family transcriptional regulator [Pseudoxanthomonas sp. UTMC 1351]|uniref:TetR/AcrR family transcriptional regulator n=1 Tax=Pseudoxanthomonas sp. UTMC 1351 TaxID=2695853 RepID=UPI0034CE875E